MPLTHASRVQPGFTLVELLVISPLLVILVAVMIGFFVSLTGDAIMSRERNTMIYSTQNALDRIETDIRLSSGVVYETGALPAGQGANSGFTGTTSFRSSADILVLELRATDKNSLDPTRKFLHYDNSPLPCDGSVSPDFNEAVRYSAIYFLDGTDLTRRTVVSFGGRTVCGIGTNPNSAGIAQHNSCKTTNNSTCYSRDAIVAKNVSDIDFRYFLSHSSQAAVTPSPTADIVSIEATVTSTKDAAGSSISHTGKLRAARIN